MENKKRIPIRKAVLIRFVVIFTLLFVLVVSATNNINDVRATKNSTAILSEQIVSLTSITGAHHDWVKNFLITLTYGNAFTGSLDANSCSLGIFLARADVSSDPNFTSFISSVKTLHDSIHSEGAKVIEMMAYDQVGAQDMFLNHVVPDVNSLVKLLEQQEILLSEKSAALDKQLEYDINVAMITNFICTFSVAFVCVTTILYIRVKLEKPLGAIEAECEKLAHGDLDLSFDLSSNVEEIHGLAEAMEFSTKELKRMIGEIDGTIDELAKKNFTVYPSMTFPGEFSSIESSLGELISGIRSTFGEIGMTSSQVSTASEQFTIGSQLLADGSTEQAASVDELSITMVTMTDTMKESVQNARAANDLGKSAAEMMQQSSGEMNELMHAIRDIEESAASINNIIKTISDIASQTNILALNAAVEAARAGESGKGFAVVADEVRNLAQKSAEAVKNTTALIEHCLEVVTSGASMASHTNESFATMRSDVTQVIELITHIATNLEDQNESLTSFAEGMDQISAVVQTNTATSEETASTSEELNAQVKSLDRLVGEFKIRDAMSPSTPWDQPSGRNHASFND